MSVFTPLAEPKNAVLGPFQTSQAALHFGSDIVFATPLFPPEGKEAQGRGLGKPAELVAPRSTHKFCGRPIKRKFPYPAIAIFWALRLSFSTVSMHEKKPVMQVQPAR